MAIIAPICHQAISGIISAAITPMITPFTANIPVEIKILFIPHPLYKIERYALFCSSLIR